MSARRPAVMDTSLLLALCGAGALDPLISTSRYDWYLTPLVRADATSAATRDAVDRAIGAGWLQLAELDTANQAHMRAWTTWELEVDPGEAEVIALAVANEWMAGLEDRQAQRALDRERGKGHWINAIDLLQRAVRDSALSFAEADILFTSLSSYPAYHRRGVASLVDLEPSAARR
jgi:hypothetical protein